MTHNPYIPGTWESKNWALMQAGKSAKQQAIARIVAKYELEPDEFFTAEQKAAMLPD